MSPEIIKVCGIKQPSDAIHAARVGATAIGMVFYAGSPRFVKLHEAAMIAAVVPPGTLKVGVFVNEPAEAIRTIAAAARLDVVQLHGDEKPEDCAALEGLRVWKALPVGADFDAAQLKRYQVEAFLLDSPAGADYGGSGRTFPWPLAREAAEYGRVILAGGLSGANVGEAIREVRPWGVDASSKLESLAGVKDPDAVRLYVEAALSAAGDPRAAQAQ
jgi:phosphoribosylanthranilate isomerase